MRTGAHAVAAYPVRPRTLLLLSSSSSALSTTFVVVVILLHLVCSSYYVLGAEENQAEILRGFKAGFNNGGDPALADWNANPMPPCTAQAPPWRGVLCFHGSVWGLQLENMGLSGRIDLDALVPLRMLRTLSFNNNSFEGAMPDWRKLGALKALFVNNNGFSGNIDDEAFKGMTSLKKVYMANNKFTGPIPSSLESPKLIELQLENNQFTGEIPFLGSENLKIMNVANNQLEGPIPAHLQKMDPKFFAGNPKLCGPPLQNPCTDPLSSNKLSSVKIALIVAFSLLAVIIIILILIFVCRRARTEKPMVTASTKGGISPAEADAAAARAIAAANAKGAVKKGSGQPAGGGGGQVGKLTFVDEGREKFDLQDLMRASAEVLGSGNFGASYKAVLVEGEAVVVKRFKKMNSIGREDFHEHMRRLGRLKHRNLLPLVAYLYRKEEKLLVFDYIENTSLAKYLHGKHSEEHPVLSWEIRLKIIKGVARGLMYLHNELPRLIVPHAHLKSSNVLLDDNFNALLTDYTLAPIVNPNQIGQVLVAYKSPEYVNHYRLYRKTDVWCLGILILEVLTGNYLIAQGSGHHSADLAGWIRAIVQEVSTDMKQAFDKEMVVGSEKCRVEMEKLLQIGIACCEEDPEKRLDMEEAVKQIEQVQES